jgi:hypothetical protein
MVAALVPQGLLVDPEEAAMPRQELADTVNLVRESDVEREEVVEAVTRLVVHEPRRRRKNVKAFDGVQVLELLKLGHTTPGSKSSVPHSVAE